MSNALVRRIGDAAKNAFHTNPENTVFDAKRLIGRKYDDAEVRRDVKHWPFKLTNKGGKPMINVKHKGELKEFTPEEVRLSPYPSPAPTDARDRSPLWSSQR